MKEYSLYERSIQLGEYLLEHRGTVRSTAKAFGLSKSTVHKDLSQRLPQANRALSREVQQILDQNREERHIRGGLATREKYRRLSAGLSSDTDH